MTVVKVVPVKRDETSQRHARLLIEHRGCVGYETREGLIGEIGVARKPIHRGKIYRAAPRHDKTARNGTAPPRQGSRT